MSEELRQKGYLNSKGQVRGEPVGQSYEGFNLGATTIEQLRRFQIVPDRSYGKFGKKKPDGIVVDRRGESPVVKLVVEYKDQHGLKSDLQLDAFAGKVVEEYCRPLGCEFGGMSDHTRNQWVLVRPDSWSYIHREDQYRLDAPIDLAGQRGRDLLAKTLNLLETTLNKPTAALVPSEAVNPTRLADQTWQDIWLASGEQPEECLATFIELLIFKFLSDLSVLKTNSSGVPVDFDTVIKKDADQVLPYYFEAVRPEIKRLFPAGSDGTSVINGIVFKPSSGDRGKLFLQILHRFRDFGSLRRIDPEFKSRIFERFLKKSLSVKNWGQYFTPRNVVKAMVEMSGIEHLPPGAVVADPASGVGGFLLEPLMHKRPYDFRADTKGLKYVGWDRDQKTTILAKANMLVHLSEALERDPVAAIPRVAEALNETFVAQGELTGSLGQAPDEVFDLVMTNPPYVTRGTGKQREFLAAHSGYYGIRGSGVENLFTQLVINGLKPGCRALMIVPDGLLLRHSEAELRAHILKTCTLEAVVSLPVNTFYSTPKKTYILSLRKKQSVSEVQQAPVFTYLVANIGETLDAKRFTIAENDLPAMASQFRLFQGNPTEFRSIDPKCRVIGIEEFQPKDHWLVNKWWPLEMREQFGDVAAESFVGTEELSAILGEASQVILQAANQLRVMERTYPIIRTVTIALSDDRYFRMSIGKRVLKKDLFRADKGEIPLYSANVQPGMEHGWVKRSNIEDFSHPSLLWSIDSDFAMSLRGAAEQFATTDHCGRLEILDPNLDPAYCQAAIVYGYGRTFGFDRVTRPSLERMRDVTLRVPVKADGTFDILAQAELAREYMAIGEAVQGVEESLASIVDLKARADLPIDVIDLGLQPGATPYKRKKRQRPTANDLADIEVARQRLRELHEDPSRIVSGDSLKDRLAALLG